MKTGTDIESKDGFKWFNGELILFVNECDKTSENSDQNYFWVGRGIIEKIESSAPDGMSFDRAVLVSFLSDGRITTYVSSDLITYPGGDVMVFV